MSIISQYNWKEKKALISTIKYQSEKIAKTHTTHTQGLERTNISEKNTQNITTKYTKVKKH